MKACLEMALLMVPNIGVKKDILKDDKYVYLFSVEEVNRRALKGTPFRDAYKEVGIEIEEGNFNPQRTVKHTHEGSIGNLCNKEIQRKMKKSRAKINDAVIEKAIQKLLKV